jgi:hypothetical protein
MRPVRPHPILFSEPEPSVEQVVARAERLFALIRGDRPVHYRNGREAKNGDKVIVVPQYGTPYIGILYDAKPGNDFCNGKVAPTSYNDPCPNLKECLHLDDAAEAFAKPDAPSAP